MANCDVRITLDPTNTYRALEPVRGTVQIQAAGPVEAKAVLIELTWRVRGGGNPGSRTVHKATLHTGTVPGPMNLPFELTLPNGPVSHQAATFQVEWFIEARVDINWAIDPKCQVTIPLLPSPDVRQPYQFGSENPTLGPDSSQPIPANAKPISIVFGCMGLAGLLIALLGFRQRDWGTVIFGSVFIAIPIAGLIVGFRVPRRLAERRLGKVQVTVEPLQPRPGDKVRIQLQARPNSGLVPGSAKAVLRWQETTARGTGKNRRTTTQKHHESTVSLVGPGSLSVPGAGATWSGEVEIPSNACPTFWETDNRTIWTIELHIDLPGGIDWSDTVTLGVLPGPPVLTPQAPRVSPAGANWS